MTSVMSYDDALDIGAVDRVATRAEEHAGAGLPVRELTRLLHVDCPDEAWLARTTFALRRVREGESLLRAGDRFHSLYVVRSGCFKTVFTDLTGIEQVLGFPMRGDLIGADGIDCDFYGSSSVSLDTSEVVIVPLSSLAQLGCECPALDSLLYRVLSRELVRVQNMTWVLGTLDAEGRVAAFLLDLSARFGALGYSPCAFNLRMTRQEIGSYLGLKLETVSRTLSALNACGSIEVHQRSVDILDPGALRRVIDPAMSAGLVRAPRAVSTPARSAAANAKRARKPRPLLRTGFAGQHFAAA